MIPVTSLAVQWLGLRASTAGGTGSIPAWAAKKLKKKKKKELWFYKEEGGEQTGCVPAHWTTEPFYHRVPPGSVEHTLGNTVVELFYDAFQL